MQALDIDFTAFSGRCAVWPDRIGALYGKSEPAGVRCRPARRREDDRRGQLLTALRRSRPPSGLEAGTPNVAGVIGLSAALEWLAQSDIGCAEKLSRVPRRAGEEALAKRPGFRLRCQQSSLLAFEFDGIHRSDLRTPLAESGIALRAGQHCAQPLLAFLGQRHAGPFAPNTQDDVVALVHAVDRAWKFWWINDNPAPFGTTITDATLRQTFALLNQWEDKYRQLILLVKSCRR